jgi:hypothetical protein
MSISNILVHYLDAKERSTVCGVGITGGSQQVKKQRCRVLLELHSALKSEAVKNTTPSWATLLPNN